MQAAVVLGDRFSFLRGSRGPVRFDAGLETAVHARFRLEMVGRDMLSSDWYIGIPVEFSYRDTGLELRPYHHSAHMGDEALLRSGLPTIEATQERFEVLLSQRWNSGVRTYAGTDVMWGGPADPELDPRLHAGMEGTTVLARGIEVAGGVDAYGALDQLRWSLVGGVRFPLLGRFYTLSVRQLQGPTLLGQFPDQRERAWGIEGSMR